MRRAIRLMTAVVAVMALAVLPAVAAVAPPVQEGGPAAISSPSVVQRVPAQQDEALGGGAKVTVLVLGGALGLALMMAGPALKDALLKVTKALPNGANTIYSDSIDTGKSTTQGVQPGEVEFLLTAPALAVADLADAATMKYSIMVDAEATIDAESTALFADCITQTGAGGAGAAAATFRFRLPSSAARYVGFRAVNSGDGDASDKSATLESLF